MAQTRTAEQAAEFEGEAGCALTCECWDCRSYRRHLLKLTAVLLLACGLGGEVGWQRGLWRGADAVAGRAPSAEVELASMSSPSGGVWF